MTVAEGWYRGRLGFRGGRREVYGTDIGPIAQLELALRRRHDRHGRDGSPLARRARPAPRGQPVRRRDVRRPTGRAGVVDAGLRRRRLGRGQRARRRSATSDDGADRPAGPPDRDDCGRWRSTTSPSGATIVDFGQNISGRVRITVDGQAGDTVTLRHAEVLEHGELGTRPLRGAAATDTLHARRWRRRDLRADVHDPRLPLRRRSTGWPGELTTGRDRGRRVPLRHGAHRQVRLLARRAQPAPRERPLEHARQLRRPAHRLPAARRAPRLDRRHPGVRADGVLPLRLRRLPDVVAAGPRRRAAASSAPCPPYVPWIDLLVAIAARRGMGRRGGRRAVGAVRALRRHRRAARGSTTACAPGSTRSPSSPATSHLWDTGFQFGDWLDPAAPPDDPGAARTDQALVATAYHAHTARLLARAAGGARPRRGRSSATNNSPTEVVEAFNDEFVTPTGRLASDAQTAYALALRFDLLVDRRAARPRRAPPGRAGPAGGLPHRHRLRRHAARVRRTGRRRLRRRRLPPACCRSAARPGCTRCRWERPPSGSAGTACCPTARSTPAT